MQWAVSGRMVIVWGRVPNAMGGQWEDGDRVGQGAQCNGRSVEGW